MDFLKRSIVAVDDSPIILKMLECLLKEKYAFRGFTKGDRALTYLQERFVNLIILDIDMPDMNGVEVLDMIRNELHLETPIIMLTSNNDKNHVVECFKHGANDYVVKPIDEAAFMQKLEKFLE